jgi:LysR family transcriptional regulator, hydrogen peroxide-inducible genes activator
MNLRDLRYIVRVAELGHFGKAAQACHVSQPTLSGQILKLEDELGVVIFERVGKSIRTTAVGEQIIAHARRCLAAASDIALSAQAHQDPLAGALRIGVIPTLAPYLMPYVLPQARVQMPSAPLHLVEDLTGNLLPLVLDGVLDGALIATPKHHDRLIEEHIFTEPFYVVMPHDHALAHHEHIKTEALDPRALLLLAEGHCLRDQALDLCGAQEHHRNDNSDVRATSLETLLHLTAAGYGLTLVPQLAVESWRALTDKLIARPLAGAQVGRDVRLVYRRDMPRAQALSILATLIRTSLPTYLNSISPQSMP